MKLASTTRFNVIVVLVPIAIYAASTDGCSTTTQRPGQVSKAQFEETIVGNTFSLPGEEAYALVAEDGGLKGLNLPSGATTGRWEMDEKGLLCVHWDTPEGDLARCDTLSFYGGDIGYEWNGSSLDLLEGNPKDL